MPSTTSRSNAEWLNDLRGQETSAEALADLREYLLRAVFLYLERHHEDLTHLDRRELESLAEDFTQEALLQIQAKLDTFRGESKFTTWAYRFVINIAAADLRLRRWQTVSMDSLVGEDDVPLFSFLGDQEAADPETSLVRNQIVALLRQIIEQELTERQRYALIRVHFNNVPMEQVARELDSTPNNVYKLIHDARRKLREGLRKRYYSEGDILAIFGEP